MLIYDLKKQTFKNNKPTSLSYLALSFAANSSNGFFVVPFISLHFAEHSFVNSAICKSTRSLLSTQRLETQIIHQKLRWGPTYCSPTIAQCILNNKAWELRCLKQSKTERKEQNKDILHLNLKMVSSQKKLKVKSQTRIFMYKSSTQHEKEIVTLEIDLPCLLACSRQCAR